MMLTSSPERIDEHSRQASALAELLQSHFGDPRRDPMADEVMACLMENLASHLRHIRALNSEEAHPSPHHDHRREAKEQ